MKLILHIGPPKTGTTALQNALFDSKIHLLEKSILYPDSIKSKSKNHGELCAIFVPYANAPRGMRKVSEEEYRTRGTSLKHNIEAQARLHMPKTMILSSEWFTRAYDAPGGHKLIEFAETLGAEAVEVLIYARRPSDVFLSDAQQRLRASSQFAPLFDRNINDVVSGFQRICPNFKITVRTFDRKVMHGGNVVSDFARTFLPDCEDILNNVNTTGKSNPSISSEAMVILQDFRRFHFADQEDVFNRPTKRLLSRLRRIDAGDGRPRPKLKDEWRDFYDYGDKRALVLRDRYGIAFSDFDYARLERADFASLPPQSQNVAEKVEVDFERLSNVVNRLGRSGWSPTRKGARWLRGLTKRIDAYTHPKLPIWRRMLS